MMTIDRTGIEERLARIEQMIERYRVAKEHQSLLRAIELRRTAEVLQQLRDLDTPPERIH